MALSLNEKVEVMEAKEEDKLSVREIMTRVECGEKLRYTAHLNRRAK
jgi:hypothetical protein